MSIVPKIIQNFFTESPETKERRKRIEAELHMKNVCDAATVLRDNGITCSCKSLAIPTVRKGKIYRCIRCNKQFANAFYNLGDSRNSYERRYNHSFVEKLNMNYYKEAVTFLTKENK